MSLDACAALVARGDPDRFAAAMTAPVGLRGRLLVLYAYNLEIARAPVVASEPMIAEIRLQWWRDALAEIAAGKPPRAHEVAGPLADVIAQAELPVALLDAMAAARRHDAGGAAHADTAALWDYIDDTAGNLAWAAALALGAPGGAEPVVRDHAAAAGMGAWLAAIPALRAAGRAGLPHDVPAGAEVAVVRALATEGCARLARARARRTSVPAAVRPALLAGWQGVAALRTARAQPAQMLDQPWARSEFARRLSLLWQSASGRW